MTNPDPDFQHKHDFLTMVIDWGIGFAMMIAIGAVVYFVMGMWPV